MKVAEAVGRRERTVAVRPAPPLEPRGAAAARACPAPVVAEARRAAQGRQACPAAVARRALLQQTPERV